MVLMMGVQMVAQKDGGWVDSKVLQRAESKAAYWDGNWDHPSVA